MSDETKIFAGKEFRRTEIEGMQGVCWSGPSGWSDHPIIVCERSEELWMLYDARTRQEMVAIDLLGVEIVLKDWFSLENRLKVRAAIAQAMA